MQGLDAHVEVRIISHRSSIDARRPRRKLGPFLKVGINLRSETWPHGEMSRYISDTQSVRAKMHCTRLQCPSSNCDIITQLATFAPPQPHGLAVLLQLGDELVALLDHVDVLLVLVVGPVRLDDALDAVDGARYAVGGDELGEVPGLLADAPHHETKAYLSRKSTVTPKSLAMLCRPTTRYDWRSCW